MNEQIAMTSQVTEISDPQLRQIRDEIYLTVVLAAAKAVGHLNDPEAFPMPRHRNSLEHVLLNRLKQRPAFQQQRAAAQMERVLHATGRRRKRMLGEFAQVDLKRDTPVADQVDALQLSRRLTPEALASARVHGPLFVGHDAPVQVEPEVEADEDGVRKMKGELKIHHFRQPMGELIVVDKPEAPDVIKPWRTLRLRVLRTRCEDETDGFLGSEAGDDEMILGGHIVDATGDTKKAGILHLGHAFDDGDDVTYDPPLIFGSYDLQEDATMAVNGQAVKVGWPRTYYAVVVLAEEDMGGFPDFLTHLSTLLIPAIKEKVTEALVAAGASLAGGIGAAIGAALGAIFGELVDAIFGLLVSIWEDDTFVPLTLAQTLPFPMPPWGQATSPKAHLWWKGHGGHYKLWFDWEMAP